MDKSTSKKLKVGEREHSPFHMATEDFFDFFPKKKKPNQRAQ